MKKFYKDKKGSSLVFTIIAMSFISLLALAVITMTITNIRLKDSGKKSQKDFYDTDAIVDNIKAGIQDLSSKSSASAYTKALSSYTKVLSGGTTSLKEIYDAVFLKQMVKELSGADVFDPATTAYKYKDEIIRGYLTASQCNSYQAHAGGLGDMIYDNGSLILKDVEVIATKNSYKTHLKTDIHIDIPSVTTETHSEYLDYALIADNQIIVNQNGVNNINGNVYAGTVRRDLLDRSKETGIYVDGGATLNISANNVITRGDIALNNNSTLNISGNGSETANVWVENIITSGGSSSVSGGNTLTIDGECNVADDLSLNGEDDSVTLKGGYYGYNYNDNYDSINIVKNADVADFSSAILINGKKCSLNMESLDKLILAGRTFISKNSNSEKYDGTTKPVQNKDIMLGESLTVKGSQLAYYVGDKYWEIDNTKPTGHDVTNKCLYFRYANDVGDNIYVFKYGEYMKSIGLIDDNGDEKINLFDYVDFSNPLVYYYRNDTSVSPKPVTYFYLNFKSEKESSQFYSVIMNQSNKGAEIASVESRFMSDSIGIKIKDTAIMMRSGNIVYRDGAKTDLKLKLSNEAISPDSGLAVYAKSRSKEYMSRQLALIPDYDDAMISPMWRLPSDPTSVMSKKGLSDNTNLFNKLVQMNKLPSTGVERGSIEGGFVAVASGDYVWNSSEQGKTEFNGCDHGIIIAKGDVTLERDFYGMIIAGGDIKFGVAGINAGSDTERVTKMFSKDKGSATPLFYNKLTKYFKKVVDSTISANVADNKETVTYENWKRQ